MTEHKYYSF